MGYDPRIYLTGRSALETASIGVDLLDDEVSFRVNFITVEPSQSGDYEDFIIKDHAAGDITTEESRELLDCLKKEFEREDNKFYLGTQYRHCLVTKGEKPQANFVPPHDILEKRAGDYLLKDDESQFFNEMTKRSYEIFKDHQVNKARVEKGLNPANSIWIWGAGTRPDLPNFNEKYCKDGCVISAVDLIKGIGIFAGLKILEVDGITGSIDTNFEAKAQAAIDAYKNGNDMVYLHMEATDECSHQGNLEKKILAVEYMDQRAIKPVVEYLKSTGEPFKVLIIPDHRTPIAIRTHTSDPVPYVIYDSTRETPVDTWKQFNEKSAEASGNHFEEGHQLTDYFFQKN
jgi:2,3-bisphosphoglycerate-independent phosphoglycerate mutase